MTKIVDLLIDGENQFPYTHFQAIEGLVDFCFPVGSVIDNQLEDFDPNETYPGSTWERYAQGKIPIGVNEDDADFDTAGKTGGAKTVTLTKDHIPKDLSLTVAGKTAIGGSKSTAFGGGTAGYGASGDVGPVLISNAGGQAHNNMPPYIAVYMWVRVA